MGHILREYRIEISERAIALSTATDPETNALALAIKAHYPPEKVRWVKIDGNIIIVEFPNTVLMFGMGNDCKRFYRDMVTSQPLEPQEIHLYRYLLAADYQPNVQASANNGQAIENPPIQPEVSAETEPATEPKQAKRTAKV